VRSIDLFSAKEVGLKELMFICVLEFLDVFFHGYFENYFI
jgi:hypothetical protein